MKNTILLVLSLAVLCAYFYTGYVIIMHEAGPSIDPQTGMVYGSVSSLAGVVIAYWFGSSKGSSDKDQMLSDLAAQKKESGHA